MFNRKERLQISKKLKIKGKRPSKGDVNWRLVNSKKKQEREQQTLMELEERNGSSHYGVNLNNGLSADPNCSTDDQDCGTDLVKNQAVCWYSLSVALPGSILNNIQTSQLRAYITGQLARTLAIFCVEEVIIFDEMARMTDAQLEAYCSGNWTGNEPVRDNNSECNFYMARIFEYLECPQYLRKSIFPIQNSLQFAGLLNPLDAIHHLRSTDLKLPFREGIVLEKPAKNGQQRCDIGLDRDLILANSAQPIPPYTRVTVKIESMNDTGTKKLKGVLTSPKAIREQAGVYWGYSIRIAKCLSEVIDGGGHYDVVIGTSERGTPLSELPLEEQKRRRNGERCKILIVFGGLGGLEAAIDADHSIQCSDPADYFPNYVNCLPDQGSRVIRTEEAIPICLTGLKYKLDGATNMWHDTDDEE